jgi:hypothetical protein
VYEYITFIDKLGFLKPMVQLVCYLELRCKSYGYISSVSTFPPSSAFMEGEGIKNVDKKSMSVENK